MKSRLLVIPFAVMLLAGACGGGEEDLTLEEYFLEVRTITDEYREGQGEFVIEQQAREEGGEETDGAEA
ncbi:hypothetical protein LCGC14_2114640 [marine sediment metagenome]|uniref:Uncharacterized protein n=1 Tax=marine sediment metagenome TaxID=412755 RepID=A0A0F9E626_9ZZZZ